MIHTVGKRLKEIRNVKKFSQKEFACYLGVSLRSYEKWESGKRLPDLRNIIKIADKLNVSVDWLLGRDNLFIINYSDIDFLKEYFKG